MTVALSPGRVSEARVPETDPASSTKRIAARGKPFDFSARFAASFEIIRLPDRLFHQSWISQAKTFGAIHMLKSRFCSILRLLDAAESCRLRTLKLDSSIEYSSQQDFERAGQFCTLRSRGGLEDPKSAAESPASGYTCIEDPRIDGWKEMKIWQWN
jgi:hypothetical protein